NSARGSTFAATPRRAATSSARTPGRLESTSTGTTPGRRPSATASSTASRFEPRPETRTARRTRPPPTASEEGDALRVRLERHHRAHPNRIRQRRQRHLRELGAHDHGQADPQVEGAHHLVVGDIPTLLDEAEDPWHAPAAGLHLHAEPGRQRARDVVDTATASDVREGQGVAARLTQCAAQEPDVIEVAALRLEQDVTQRA